jgi:hypothetical protein
VCSDSEDSSDNEDSSDSEDQDVPFSDMESDVPESEYDADGASDFPPVSPAAPMGSDPTRAKPEPERTAFESVRYNEGWSGQGWSSAFGWMG